MSEQSELKAVTPDMDRLESLVGKLVSAAYFNGQKDCQECMSDEFYRRASQASDAAKDELLQTLRAIQTAHQNCWNELQRVRTETHPAPLPDEAIQKAREAIKDALALLERKGSA